MICLNRSKKKLRLGTVITLVETCQADDLLKPQREEIEVREADDSLAGKKEGMLELPL